MGEKIIATKTDRLWGFCKGDILEIDHRNSSNPDYVYARNLTHPGLGGSEHAFLHKSEFKRAKETDLFTVVAEYRFLGVPILRKYTKG